jgi:hypothetical protein
MRARMLAVDDLVKEAENLANWLEKDREETYREFWKTYRLLRNLWTRRIAIATKYGTLEFDVSTNKNQHYLACNNQRLGQNRNYALTRAIVNSGELDNLVREAVKAAISLKEGEEEKEP